MSLKQNSLKLLLCIYATQHAAEVGLSLPQLRELMPGITDTGCRSLVILIEKKKLIYRKRIFKVTSYHLTDLGLKALKDAFPSLNDSWAQWKGEWMAVSFLKAPASDKQFRFLRTAVLADGALPLGRGLYVKANGFTKQVLHEFEHSYQASVTVFWVKEWLQGFDKPVIYSYYDLNDISGVISGISNNIERLLSIYSTEKKLNKKEKNEFIFDVDRFCQCLRECPGFLYYYFPELPGLNGLLVKIGRLLLI